MANQYSRFHALGSKEHNQVFDSIVEGLGVYDYWKSGSRVLMAYKYTAPSKYAMALCLGPNGELYIMRRDGDGNFYSHNVVAGGRTQ